MFDLPQKEKDILAFWEKEKIFAKTLEKTKGKKPFVFYEGPPTANGKPGIHHVLARAYKDVVLRFKTMQGFFVPRRAGWDTHGLPVELEVEKALALNSKKDIERYGIDKFVAKAKESVWRYKQEWEELTRRMGFWIDLENPYITYENSYIESLWCIIKTFWEKGLLEESFKVVPWCYRCGTPLSSHEVAQGYKKVNDAAVYVGFELVDEPDTYILAWTTTPWTLPGNVGLAINPAIQYVKAQVGDEAEFTNSGVTEQNKGFYKKFVVLAEDFLRKQCDDYDDRKEKDEDIVFQGYALRDIKKFNLLDRKYRPLFTVPELQSGKSYRVYAADFVTTTEGTGIVHTAVMYGEDDYELGTRAELPKFHTVTEEGKFIDSLGEGLAGLHVKDKGTEEKIVSYLQKKGLLFATENYLHDYPFCWRCKNPLLYYATKSWFVKTTAVKEELLKNNAQVNWVPSHIKEGRFGNFLEEVKDWAFSRRRYWGTPLPIWKCEKCGEVRVIGSMEELGECVSGRGNEFLLVRHGESVNNVADILSCFPEKEPNGLTKKGIAQVKKAASLLAKKGVDIIVSSPLLRTQKTANIIAQETNAQLFIDERLREINFGPFNKRPRKSYRDYWESLKGRFTKKPEEGMENFHHVRKRVIAAIQDINKTHENKTIVLVTHQSCAWVLEGALRGFSDEEIATLLPDDFQNGEIRNIPSPYLPFNDEGEADLHRPFIDEVIVACGTCKGIMRRVEEIADVWFDSGAMPFAQTHFPFAQFPISNFQFPKKSKASISKSLNVESLLKKIAFPADYICEAIDQTRGWFYTLLTVATLLGFGPAYKNVISLGHVLDEKGRKMSKSLGNIIDPFAAADTYGMDAIRWYFFVVNPPGFYKRFDAQEILSHQRRFLLTLFNSANFLLLYASKEQKKVRSYIKKFHKEQPDSVLDRWMVSRLHETMRGVTQSLDAYDITEAARALEAFTDDLSNWYIRRSRERIKGADGHQVTALLYITLSSLAKLIAPFVPFSAEILFRAYLSSFAVLEEEAESIHLVPWPHANEDFIDERLHEEMARAREIVALNLSKRAVAGIPVRYVVEGLSTRARFSEAFEGIAELIREEVNVKKIETGAKEDTLDITRSPELLEEGFVRDLIRQAQELRKKEGLKPGDVITLAIHGDDNILGIIKKSQQEIVAKVGADRIEEGEMQGSKAVTLNFQGKDVIMSIISIHH